MSDTKQNLRIALRRLEKQMEENSAYPGNRNSRDREAVSRNHGAIRFAASLIRDDINSAEDAAALASLAEFKHRCNVLIDDEQRKLSPDNALISVLCDAIRLTRENGQTLLRDVIDAMLRATGRNAANIQIGDAIKCIETVVAERDSLRARAEAAEKRAAELERKAEALDWLEACILNLGDHQCIVLLTEDGRLMNPFTETRESCDSLMDAIEAVAEASETGTVSNSDF